MRNLAAQKKSGWCSKLLAKQALVGELTNIITRHGKLLLLAVCVYLSSTFALAQNKELTAIFLPFESISEGSQDWLSLAIPDLLGQSLEAQAGWLLLERHKLNVVIEELELQTSGFTESANVSEIGQVMVAQAAVFGSFQLKGNQITIHASVLDVQSEKVKVKAAVTGNVKHLETLSHQLAIKLLGHQIHIGTQSALSQKQILPYRAMAYYYQSIKLADAGLVEDAIAAALKASQKGPDNLAVKSLLAELWLALGKTEYASFFLEALIVSAPDSIQAQDARLDLIGLYIDRELWQRAEEHAQTLQHYANRLGHPIAHQWLGYAELAKIYFKQKNYLAAYQNWTILSNLMQQYQSLSFDKRQGILVNSNGFSRRHNWQGALELGRISAVEMTALLPKLDDRARQRIQLPRGVYLLKDDDSRQNLDKAALAKSLFLHPDGSPYENWQEHFYLVVAPYGHSVSSIYLSVTGKAYRTSANISYALRLLPFPIPSNHRNNWLASIYGQTKTYTQLNKKINFYGESHEILALHTTEGNSDIQSVGFSVNIEKISKNISKLKKRQGVGIGSSSSKRNGYSVVNGVFVEGQKLFELPLPAADYKGPSQLEYSAGMSDKKQMALALDGDSAQLLVSMRSGHRMNHDLYAAQLDSDRHDWSELTRLPISSQSDDVKPKLIQRPFESPFVFWLSNLKRQGGEIWYSKFGQRSAVSKGKIWHHPTKIPLEEFGCGQKNTDTKSDDQFNSLEKTFDFSVTQDNWSQWVLAIPSLDFKTFHLLKSSDLINWELISSLKLKQPHYAVQLTATPYGEYWLSATGEDAKTSFWRSTNLKTWVQHRYALGRYATHWTSDSSANYGRHQSISLFPHYIFGYQPNNISMVFADNRAGIQYSNFYPGVTEPKPDIVKDSEMGAFAIDFNVKDEAYWLAELNDDQIGIRAYRHLASPYNQPNNSSSPLYVERSKDSEDQLWQRYFARFKFIKPDVTAVHRSPSGRLWWGIESGLMSLYKKSFFASDVSMGFFHHHVTDIESCGDNAYFASKFNVKSEIAFTSNLQPQRRSKIIELPKESGQVRSLMCQKNKIYVGTSLGWIIRVGGDRIELATKITKSAIESVAMSSNGKQIAVGTSDGDLLVSDKGVLTDDQTKWYSLNKVLGSKSAVLSVLWRGENTLFVAQRKQGLVVLKRKRKAWTKDTYWLSVQSTLIYDTLAKLEFDSEGMLWGMPAADQMSQGLLKINLNPPSPLISYVHPPSDRLNKMVDMDVSGKQVIVGTDDRGVYQLFMSTETHND
jgi:tetratricopeptide (TPR) repeat protein